ncbi:hypothetical protein [Yoonia litorea]|uniref:Neutral zinc metallopeptidase n=1 Tax=Yoonia litorea TaxID=1123755 RepID=A0A1I6M270_9RHOB|nr:hypothetical protein [Yoonia litorea]SFS09817.1 hypothetical protein SAMN05444714_1155 [Yoonia litorea]
MRLLYVLIIVVLGGPATADVAQRVAAVADASFARMPQQVTADRIAGQCGADETVHPTVAYCTSQNRIYVSAGSVEPPFLSYLVAHVYGHAVQVQHGVADVALRTIRARPEDEAMLRGWVERQVDCIAGFVLAQADLPLPDLTTYVTDDPFDRPHWGRSPLSRGPHLPIPVSDRMRWLKTGYERGLSACAVGEFDASLLLAAQRN